MIRCKEGIHPEMELDIYHTSNFASEAFCVTTLHCSDKLTPAVSVKRNEMHKGKSMVHAVYVLQYAKMCQSG